MAGSTRCSFTLPAETAESIAVIASRCGVSRSALVAELLGRPIAELRKLFDVTPPKGTPTTEGDIARMRGASVEIVRKIIGEAQELARDVDPEQKLL